MEYRICDASDTELAALAALYDDYQAYLASVGLTYEYRQGSAEEIIRAHLRSKLFCVLCAFSGDVPVGFLVFSYQRLPGEYRCGENSVIGYINDLYVSPDCRRDGIAGALVREAKERMRASGVTTVELQVVGGNLAGERFWRSQGMVPVRTIYTQNF